MNARKMILTAAAVAVAVPVLKKMYDEFVSKPPVTRMVEETLHHHEGEDTPFVHAFEEALEEENVQEEQLARSTGLRHPA